MFRNMLRTWRWENTPIFLNFFIVLAPVGVVADELSVYEKIMTTYNKNVRPTNKSGAATIVSLELRHFNLLNMIWEDERLKWDPIAFDRTTSIIIPLNVLWRPDVIVTTGLTVNYMVRDDQLMAELFSNGTVMWRLLSAITNECSLSVETFPFDMQTCYISFGSWMHDSSKITLVAGTKMKPPNSTVFDFFYGNSEWTILSVTTSLSNYMFPDGMNFAGFTYEVQLKRQPIYYVCVLLIPTFMTATICLFGLFVPAMNTGERTEKVNMGMATLLSMAVILGIVSGEMPKTTTLPLLGFYVLAELLLCTIGMLISMLIMVAHQRTSTRLLQPPRWINIIVLFKMNSTELAKPEKENVPTKNRSLINNQNMSNQAESLTNLISVKRLNQVLENVEKYIDDKKTEDYILLQWVIIFDRIDTFFLILFNVVNVIMSAILLFN